MKTVKPTEGRLVIKRGTGGVGILVRAETGIATVHQSDECERTTTNVVDTGDG